uniref:Uncharacterized protein n=1 Tax=Salix viminalis TaxID=40686 RepID=A0A6N2KT14_SALVM
MENRVGSEQCRVGGYGKGKEVENEDWNPSDGLVRRWKRLNRVREEECCREKAAEDGENSVTMGEQNPKTWEDEVQDSWAYLSDPEWAEDADRIHESEERDWPEEPKPISGKCILVTEKILPLKEEDPSLLISFQANIRDRTMIIDAQAKENPIEDAERTIKTMNENGILPDILTTTVLVHISIGKLKELWFLTRHRHLQFHDHGICKCWSTELGESLMREMEARDIKPMGIGTSLTI